MLGILDEIIRNKRQVSMIWKAETVGKREEEDQARNENGNLEKYFWFVRSSI